MQPSQTILVIDDDADIRTLVSRRFTAQGYHGYAATDSVTACAIAYQYAPDLIIVDLWLPGQAGWTVARELRADPALDNTPILVITGNSCSAAHRLAWRAGCQAIICKPFALETLEEMAATLISQCQANHYMVA